MYKQTRVGIRLIDSIFKCAHLPTSQISKCQSFNSPYNSGAQNYLYKRGCATVLNKMKWRSRICLSVKTKCYWQLGSWLQVINGKVFAFFQAFFTNETYSNFYWLKCFPILDLEYWFCLILLYILSYTKILADGSL